MTDYKEKLDDLQRAARRKAHELDEKLNVTGTVKDTARVAGDAARRGRRLTKPSAARKMPARSFATPPGPPARRLKRLLTKRLVMRTRRRSWLAQACELPELLPPRPLGS